MLEESCVSFCYSHSPCWPWSAVAGLPGKRRSRFPSPSAISRCRPRRLEWRSPRPWSWAGFSFSPPQIHPGESTGVPGRRFLPSFRPWWSRSLRQPRWSPNRLAIPPPRQPGRSTTVSSPRGKPSPSFRRAVAPQSSPTALTSSRHSEVLRVYGAEAPAEVGVQDRASASRQFQRQASGHAISSTAELKAVVMALSSSISSQ
jgi:hypothetical protein